MTRLCLASTLLAWAAAVPAHAQLTTVYSPGPATYGPSHTDYGYGSVMRPATMATFPVAPQPVVTYSAPVTMAPACGHHGHAAYYPPVAQTTYYAPAPEVYPPAGVYAPSTGFYAPQPMPVPVTSYYSPTAQTVPIGPYDYFGGYYYGPRRTLFRTY